MLFLFRFSLDSPEIQKERKRKPRLHAGGLAGHPQKVIETLTVGRKQTLTKRDNCLHRQER